MRRARRGGRPLLPSPPPPPPPPQSTPRVPGSWRHGQELTYLPLRVAYRVRGRCGGEEDLAGGHGGAGMRATRAPGVAGFPGPASRHGATPCSLHPPAPRHLLRVRGVLGDHPGGRARQAHAAALPVPQRCSRRRGAPPLPPDSSPALPPSPFATARLAIPRSLPKSLGPPPHAPGADSGAPCGGPRAWCTPSVSRPGAQARTSRRRPTTWPRSRAAVRLPLPSGSGMPRWGWSSSGRCSRPPGRTMHRCSAGCSPRNGRRARECA